MKRYNISFVLPMFNESANIEDTIARLTTLAAEICDDYEIVVIDDASTDGCGDIVAGLAAKDPCIKFIRLNTNTKFGGALNRGLEAASKEIILYTDSDMPVKEEDIKKALELLKEADIVTGYSLVIKDASLKRIFISKLYNFFVRLLFDLKIRDINAGFKIYRKDMIKGLRLISRSPFIDTEIFAEAAKRKARIKQYGLIFDLRTKGKSTIAMPSILLRSFWDMIVYKFSDSR